MRTCALVFGFATVLGGCVDVPSPLAPALGGSVGSPSHGVLVGGVSLPMKGPGFARIHDNDVHFGTPRLVSTIEFVAAELADESPGAPPLVVGDLSKATGGPSPGHHSHRSGRDADLLYFVTTPEGVPVRSPGFVRFGPDGLAQVPGKGTYVRLDTAREWRLVKALIEAPNAQVQWLFSAKPIAALVIEQARALGEDPELIIKAETLLEQPTDSEAHDDHIHMRLACSADDAVAGCEGGPRWPFLDAWPTLEITPEDELIALLGP